MRRLSAVVSDEEFRRVEKLVRAGAAKSIAQLVRQAVTEYAEKLGSAKLLNLREVPMGKVRSEVEEYLKNHPGIVWPDEMAEALGIDYRLVLNAVRALLEEGKVEEVKAEVIHA